MFIDENSLQIKVGSGDFVSMGQYLSSVKYGYHKLWDEDSGRAISGKMVATLKGLYPKLTLSFKPLTKSQVEAIAPILDSAYQKTRYYDPNKNDYITIDTYSNDWEVNNKNIIDYAMRNDPFEWTVISVDKRR
jgi:hypothetical protein